MQIAKNGLVRELTATAIIFDRVERKNPAILLGTYPISIAVCLTRSFMAAPMSEQSRSARLICCCILFPAILSAHYYPFTSVFELYHTLPVMSIRLENIFYGKFRLRKKHPFLLFLNGFYAFFICFSSWKYISKSNMHRLNLIISFVMQNNTPFFPIFGHVILLVPFALACFVNVLSAFSFEIAFRPYPPQATCF